MVLKEMKTQKKKKGIVLISTMLLLTVIIMTGIMLAVSAYSNMKISRAYKSIAKAKYAAESGTEYIRSIFYKNADFMYHKKQKQIGSINKKTIFRSEKNKEEITVTIDYENRWIKGTITEKNGDKTFFRAGFSDSTTPPSYPIDDDNKDNFPPIKYLSCNNFPSDRYGNVFELFDYKYKAREIINNNKSQILPGTAYLVVEGWSGGTVKYLESYLEKTEMTNYSFKNTNNRLEYGMTAESSIFLINNQNHQLSDATQNYASIKQNSFLYANMSYIEEENNTNLGTNKINLNLKNIKTNQKGIKIKPGAYILINEKIFFIPENKITIDENGNIISSKNNATPIKNEFFSYNSKSNNIEVSKSIICDGNLVISKGEYLKDDIISKNSNLKLLFSNSRLFVNGKKCVINSEIIGDGMIYSAGEITIGTSAFFRDKNNYPLIIAEKNIIAKRANTDLIFVGYDEYIKEIWKNFIKEEKNHTLHKKNIYNIAKNLLKTKAEINGEKISLETALKRSNLKYNDEETKLYAIALIDLNSTKINEQDKYAENDLKNNPEKLYGYRTKQIPYIKLKTSITEATIPLKNEMILFADIVSLNGDIKTEKGAKLTIFGITDICNTNENQNKIFFKYSYNPYEEIFISEGKGVKTRYKFRNIF